MYESFLIWKPTEKARQYFTLLETTFLPKVASMCGISWGLVRDPDFHVVFFTTGFHGGLSGFHGDRVSLEFFTQVLLLFASAPFAF